MKTTQTKRINRDTINTYIVSALLSNGAVLTLSEKETKRLLVEVLHAFARSQNRLVSLRARCIELGNHAESLKES